MLFQRGEGEGGADGGGNQEQGVQAFLQNLMGDLVQQPSGEEGGGVNEGEEGGAGNQAHDEEDGPRCKHIRGRECFSLIMYRSKFQNVGP